MIPEPVLEPWGNLVVVRDDLVPGGTKARVLGDFLVHSETFVYAAPAYGYAQISLAHCCRRMGKQAVIFVAKRKTLHPRTRQAQQEGARIVQVPYGYLSHVQAKARQFAADTGASLLPFGLDFPGFVEALARLAAALPIRPQEVWTVAGSGTLSRALQMAWPTAKVYAVRIGARPNTGRAVVYYAPERFEQPATVRPPFPSCPEYDAKAWRFIRAHARPGALFWNVAA